MTTTNQFYITSQPLALVSSGNNASISGTFSANAITAPTANLSSITANTVAGQTATFSGNVSANTVAGQTATFSGNVSANTVAGQTATFTGNVSANTVVGQTATFSGNVSASFLVGNGQGITGLAPPVSPMTISSFSVTDINGVALDDTALGESSYLTISGTSFGAGAVAMLGAISASATTGISQTQLRARFTGVAPGTYSLFVLNTDGTSAILPSAVTWSVSPIWDATGTLAASTKTRVFTRNLALANGDSTLTYTLASGSSLPPGTSLLGNGSLTGNIIESSNSTTSYSFTVSATDAQYQDAPKTFQLSSGFLRTFAGNANVVVSNSTYTGDTNHLAVSNSGGFVKIVSDAPAFAANAIANLGNVTLSSTFISSTELRAVVPAATEGTISPLEITNVDGSVLTNANIARWAPPAWTTASALASVRKGVAFSRTVAATHGAGTVTYAVISGSVPSGATFNTATGEISGNVSGSTDETATLALNALAPTLQTAAREFTLPFYVALYDFASHTFTNAGVTGRTGPTLAQCRAAYSTTWDENSSYFNVTGGIQYWTAPRTGLFRIEVWGAQGIAGIVMSNPAAGGLGAQMRGDFALTAGEVLRILVGQTAVNDPAAPRPPYPYGGGGGGGSFVVRQPYNTTNSILVIAGGGGGGGSQGSTGVDGVTATSGTAGRDGIAAGGIDGYGGISDPTAGGYAGAAGGGFLGPGENGRDNALVLNSGGYAFVSGGLGGIPSSTYGGQTGFGGGGAGTYSAGGGGGYSGGGGDSNTPGQQYGIQGGGGGGSYNNGTNQVNVGGTRSGHGQVTITAL